LAAVFVAAAAFISPDAFGIGSPGQIKTQSLIEMGLGTIIGAITFTGSIVAFAKLQGLVSGAPLIFRGQHPLNALIGVALLFLPGVVRHARPSHHLHPAGRAVLALGFLLILPIGGADMPVVVSMLNSYSGWAAAASASRSATRR
jgi:NAD(P) transhydrogenase subunit beta